MDAEETAMASATYVKRDDLLTISVEHPYPKGAKRKVVKAGNVSLALGRNGAPFGVTIHDAMKDKRFAFARKAFRAGKRPSRADIRKLVVRAVKAARDAYDKAEMDEPRTFNFCVTIDELD